jgi:hypothetical protein
MSLVMAKPYKKRPLAIPPYPFFFTGILVDEDWDTSEELLALADGQMTSNVTGDTITFTATGGDYFYLFSLVSNGEITFKDLENPGNGSMDGASWPTDGTEGTEYGPVIQQLNFGAGLEDWYMYRSDWPGIGTRTLRLTYARDQF